MNCINCNHEEAHTANGCTAPACVCNWQPVGDTGVTESPERIAFAAVIPPYETPRLDPYELEIPPVGLVPAKWKEGEGEIPLGVGVEPPSFAEPLPDDEAAKIREANAIAMRGQAPKFDCSLLACASPVIARLVVEGKPPVMLCEGHRNVVAKLIEDSKAAGLPTAGAIEAVEDAQG